MEDLKTLIHATVEKFRVHGFAGNKTQYHVNDEREAKLHVLLAHFAADVLGHDKQAVVDEHVPEKQHLANLVDGQKQPNNPPDLDRPGAQSEAAKFSIAASDGKPGTHAVPLPDKRGLEDASVLHPPIDDLDVKESRENAAPPVIEPQTDAGPIVPDPTKPEREEEAKEAMIESPNGVLPETRGDKEDITPVEYPHLGEEASPFVPNVDVKEGV